MNEIQERFLRVDFNYLPCVNLALYNNHVRTCSLLTITNVSGRRLSGLSVRVSGDGFSDYVSHIDIMQPDGITDITDVDIAPHVSRMMELTEAQESSLLMEISDEEHVLFSQNYPIRILPYDYWTGSSILPEILAAYVVPNSPLMAKVTQSVARYMEIWSGDPSLDGYQSLDRNRVRMQVGAVYEVLRRESLVYCNPPASFEAEGQRVRLADKVLTEKMGTCLDLALLMASVLESLGLYPLLVILNGHAFVGAWLTNQVYSHKVGDDDTYLLKEAADGNNNVVLVETTAMTVGKNIAFDEAVDMALHELREPGRFLHFIDIHRCRLEHVTPLPQFSKREGEWVLEEPAPVEDVSSNPVSQLSHYSLQLDSSSAPITRQELWERKLLDFSLRNNLINTKVGRKVIPFVSFSIENLENHLQAGDDYRVLPYPGAKIEPGTWGIYDSHLQALQYKDFISEIIQNKQIVTYLPESELAEALKYLYRSSRTSIEENGANSLFLVLGMLKWFENSRSTLPRFAPVLLMPVEIIRKGGNNYVIRMRDEGIFLNITLVELLKQQFKINLDFLNPLPIDEQGVDVKLVFTGIRRAIAHLQGWDVMEESLLGLFSFNKFVMWNDIHNNALKLKENPVISSLLENQIKWEHSDDFADARQIDKQCFPRDYAIPLDVDSSQMEAVVESGKGKSFILYGPPGTGKSQTITNMIANALYQGKRVLFVAEKMAALSVVQSRLEKVGLAPFCLELHSNKVTKSHFLYQMQKALDVAHLHSPEDFEQTSNQLHDQRMKLISNMEALHRKQPCGRSLYDLISCYLSIEGAEMDVPKEVADHVLSEDFNWWSTETEQLNAVFRLVGHPADHPLKGLEPKDNSQATFQSLHQCMGKYREYYSVYQKTWSQVHQKWPLTCTTDSDYEWLASLLSLLSDMPELNARLMDLAADPNKMAQLSEWLSRGRQRDSLKAALTGSFSVSLLDADAGALRRQWQEVCDKWFLLRFFAKRSFFKSMRIYGAVNDGNAETMLSQLSLYQQLRDTLRQQEEVVSYYMGSFAIRECERWDDVATILDRLPRILSLLSTYAQSHQKTTSEVCRSFVSLIESPWTLCRDDLSRELGLLLQDFRTIVMGRQAIEQLATVRLQEADIYAELDHHTDIWLAHDNLLRDWYQWVAKKSELEPTCLSALIRQIEQHHAMPDDALMAFEKGVFHRLIMTAVDEDEQLRMFNGMIFEQVIDEYRRQTAYFQELTKKELYCRLAANVPSQTLAAVANSEMGILKRNIINGGRGTSIRSLIDNIPTLLPKLCPCMLMSPISVAQYVDLNNDQFDLVIFDEASQMPTSEAVGAIARGKALVVVGDPKQMPPTSFFSTSQVDEDEVDLDDMESILDDCIALSMPSHYLTWHYRSRHESLIAFSNAHYYENGLYTFPSADDSMSRVRLIPIDGVYDKGHTRRNPVEAKAIVDEVVRRLSDPVLSKRSIGIVSFSKVQQNLIEDLLNEELSKQPRLEELAFNSKEPVFIKNLENVQGDERDVILFSVGYGPDKSGRVSMNFGPLNNAGGERRLNVAVSRSRYEMLVYSSLRSEHIDLRRSNAKGVIGLKAFLEYAEKNSRLAPPSSSADASEQVIIRQLSEMLREKGYESVPFVGRSKFKVDLAVVDPHDPQRYMMGILCDGKNYYETKTTRDREIVQPTILRMLNWNVMRLWAVDWYENPQRVFQHVLDMLEKVQHANPESVSSEKPETAYTFSIEHLEEESVVEECEDGIKKDYLVYELPFTPSLRYYPEQAKSMVAQLIKYEQPVCLPYLLRRFGAIVDGRVPGQINKMVNWHLRNHYRDPLSDKAVPFYWLNKASAENYQQFRVNSQRDITEIPLVEQMNALKWVVAQNVSVPRADLKRAVWLLLGFNRKTVRIETSLEMALTVLEERGEIDCSGDAVTLRDDS